MRARSSRSPRSPLSPLSSVLLLLMSALTLAACDDGAASDQPTTADASGDTTPDSDSSGSTSGTTLPPGQFKTESEDPANEYPDCINDCANAATSDDGVPQNRQEISQLKNEGFDGFAGTIDGNCHDLLLGATPTKGPDLDVLTLEGRARTLVELIVEPTGSGLTPTIYTHDGTQTLTFGGAEDAGMSARTVFAIPNLGFLPFFVIIEDEQNGVALSSGGPFVDCARFVGGPDFGYVLRVNVLPFLPTELTSGQPATAALSQPGDIVYFKFTAPNGVLPTITVQRTGTNDRFIPALAIMNTAGGQLAWALSRYDGDGRAPADGARDGTVTYSGTFITCASNDEACKTGSPEYFFAVTDWNGRGGTDFAFTVTATW